MLRPRTSAVAYFSFLGVIDTMGSGRAGNHKARDRKTRKLSTVQRVIIGVRRTPPLAVRCQARLRDSDADLILVWSSADLMC
jgi:hypothetical protein